MAISFLTGSIEWHLPGLLFSANHASILAIGSNFRDPFLQVKQKLQKTDLLPRHTTAQSYFSAARVGV